MSALPKHTFTEAEYLAFERASETKHEYYRGEILAMAGANEDHNLITFNVTGSLYVQLRTGNCRAYTQDMRVRISPTGRYVYPDVVVVCQPPDFLDEKRDTLLNPTLIIEVASPSTEKYDRTTKFDDYATLASLQEYILIEQDRPRVERYTRQADGLWGRAVANGLDQTLELPSIGCTLALAEVYARVEFEEAES